MPDALHHRGNPISILNALLNYYTVFGRNRTSSLLLTSYLSTLHYLLIIPQKAKERKGETVAPIKPVPIKSSPAGVRNPFKKQQEATKNVPSPLSLTERTLVEVHSTEPSENTDPSTIQNGETFVDWFSRNKSNLESQNPEMTPSELSRLGIRTFKTLQGKTGAVNGTPESGQKRKLGEELNGADTPITSAPKQSKLSAFAFQKKA
ncbi:uncharacterized protein LOC134647507 [Cydia amplana]|uniref:uncharacterized protein LOC134647507 n=1 Tax=Cydia amplana TaxID=1869771 RepID=UPI002FE5658F